LFAGPVRLASETRPAGCDRGDVDDDVPPKIAGGHVSALRPLQLTCGWGSWRMTLPIAQRS